MTKVLMTNDKSKQVQPVLEYRHNYKYVSNRAYAVNAVDKAISRGQFNIVLDESKLKQKKYISTEVFLFDREGNPLKIETNYTYGNNNKRFELVPEGKNTYVITGVSWPQYGDKFNRNEGRKFALMDAINQLNISSSDPNYTDLLDLKLFLQHFEIRAKDKYPHWKWVNNVISWQYIDLWNSLLNAKLFSDSNNTLLVEQAAINLVGQANYDNLFNQFLSELLDFFINGKEFNTKEEAETVDAAYYLYSSAIKQYYNELYDK
jgi:hypothetical protein